MKKYIYILVLIILLPPIFFLAIDFFNINSYLGLTETYDWLGFFGGFLGGTFGGVATFLGVNLTLKYQRNADNEKNRLSVIPILEYKIRYDRADFDNSRGQLADEGGIPLICIAEASPQDKNILEWHFNLIISNVGVGHGQISKIILTFVNGNDHQEIIKRFEGGSSYKLVKKDEEKSFKYLIYAPGGNMNENISYGLKINIGYQDLLGNKYEQLIHASIGHSSGISGAYLGNYGNFKLLK